MVLGTWTESLKERWVKASLCFTLIGRAIVFMKIFIYYPETPKGQGNYI
jgi:hypothetical protein